MSTPNNLLFDPQKWEVSTAFDFEPGALGAAGFWNAGSGFYQFAAGNGDNWSELQFFAPAGATTGDILKGTLRASSQAGSTVYIYKTATLNGAGNIDYTGADLIFQQQLAAGQTYDFQSDPLEAGDTPYIRIEPDYDTSTYDVIMTPVQADSAYNQLLRPDELYDPQEHSPPNGWNELLGVYENCGSVTYDNSGNKPSYGNISGSVTVAGNWIAFKAINRSTNTSTMKVRIGGAVVWTQLLAPNTFYTYTSDPLSQGASFSIEFADTDVSGDSPPDILVLPIQPQDSSVEAGISSSVSGLAVSFADNSTYRGGASQAGSTFAWSFGQNLESIQLDAGSSGKTPSFTYDQAGTYVALLGVTWQDGEIAGVSSVAKLITVSGGGGNDSDTQASFTAAGNNLQVTLTDTSTTVTGKTITGWLWDFGDGSIASTDQNPVHVYANPGAYTVKLSVTDSAGDTVVHTQNIAVTAPVLVGSDTYSLKAFVSYGAMSDNTLDEVALLGELSVYSATYAKDRQLFSGSAGNEGPTSVNCAVFSSIDIQGVHKDVPVDYSQSLIAISTWVYNQAAAGQFTSDVSVFLQQFNAEFGTTVQQVVAGTMRQQNAMWMPENLTFHFSAASMTSPSYTGQSRVKLWFSDHAFRTQYDEYVIEIIPPFGTLDDFFKASSQVQNELVARSTPELMEQVRAMADEAPYTLLKSIDFLWHDPVTVGHTLNSTWTFLIYGQAGNNVDAIKAELVDYILTHSTHSRDEWAGIFPDIFTSTEFILTPLWDQYAVPNQTLVQGVYSPTVNDLRARSIAIATAVGTGYTQDFVDSVLNITTVPYKSLAFLAVGGPDNRDGVSQFLQKWPDYMAVPTGNLDFDRMSPLTQGWLALFYAMLKVAEDMTDTSDIPVGMTRLHRTNNNGIPVLYIVASYDNVQYLVVAKSWLLTNSATIPDAPPSSVGGQQSGGNSGSGNTGPLAIGITDGQGGLVETGSSIEIPLNEAASTLLNMSAQGGTGPYEYSIVSFDWSSEDGPDPTIESNTGTVFISTSYGTHVVVFKVTDSLGATATVSYSIIATAE